ncbi:MAG: alpha/beta hydrolase-fold protein [Defluviitaleaceae bacterium]|nr:alpha/beta hydrolase-fold protein [Defluviitaleaceae bacterium]
MSILQANFYSDSLNRQTAFSAVIPMGSKKPLKTLYLLHGLGGNFMDWLTCTRIAYWAYGRNLAVIMPSGDNSFYLDNEKALAMYGDFFGRELVEATRELFPLSDKREDTFIAGLSMGGYGAIRTGLKYHKTFGALAGLSSALVTEDAVNFTNATPTIIGRRSYFESVFGDLDKLSGSDKDPKKLITELKSTGADIPAIYLCCGTEDFLIQHSRDFHSFLEAQGVPHTYAECAGDHNWEYWDANILKVLEWLPI